MDKEVSHNFDVLLSQEKSPYISKNTAHLYATLLIQRNRYCKPVLDISDLWSK